MNFDREKMQRDACVHAAGFAIGFASGVVTGNPDAPNLPNRCPQTAMQMGQAAGAAIAGGEGVIGSAFAGGRVIEAKLRKACGQ